MNLPIINALRENQSTYIGFSKGLLDFDNAYSKNEKCYFTKMIALNLPDWRNPEFFTDLSSVSVDGTNPNTGFPKTIQYYMENIIRQEIGESDNIVEEVTELAFWKMLRKMGLTEQQAKDTVVFSNGIATSNFVKTENNNGWGEIVAQIPNKCKSLTPAWKTVPFVANTIQSDYTDDAIYDNGLNQILFTEDQKQVLDFENFVYDEVEVVDFDFNVLLLFYTDETGIEKLHGINFVYPFENKVTHWDIEKFTQKTNEARTIGYQFKFNLKTCNNDATKTVVLELAEHTHWAVFFETLSKLNTFLELKEQTNGI